MHVNLFCHSPVRRIRVAWLSVQPQGWLSLGLADRAFNNGTAPHVTYHGPGLHFHLTPDKGAALASGIADAMLLLSSGETWPWARLTSRSISELKSLGTTRGGTENFDLEMRAPSEAVSIVIKASLFPQQVDRVKEIRPCVWLVPYFDYSVRLDAHFTFPAVDMVEWLHAY